MARLRFGISSPGYDATSYVLGNFDETERPLIEEGMTQAPGGARERRHFQISGGGFVATGADDETVSRQFEFIRQRVGFYGSTRAYWPVLAQHDLLDLGEQLNHLSKTDGWDQMAGLVDDDVVRLFAAVGRHDELVPAIAERFVGVSDSIGASASPEIAADLPPDLIQEIQAL